MLALKQQSGPLEANGIGLALCAVLAAIAFHGLVLWDPRSHAYPGMVGWFFESSDASPQVIFAIVAALLFHRRRALREAFGSEPAPRLGALGLLAGTALQLWAQWVDAQDLAVVSLIFTALGAALCLGGRPLVRQLAPPLALLVFAIPIPGALNNLVVFPAQQTSASFADLMLRALGFDVTIHSDIVSLRGEKFEVIETCSGLRSLQTLALLAASWAVYFRCSLRHGLWLIAAAPLIAFVTNGIRVMVLVLDSRPAVRESHTAQGIVMFLVGTLALSLVDRALLRLLRPAESALPAAEPGPSARPSERRGTAHLVLALGVMALAALALPRLRPAAPVLPPAPGLPRPLAGWSVGELPIAGHFLGSVYFTQRESLAYERDYASVTVFLGWDDRQARVRSLLSEKNSIPGSGWVVEERGPALLEPGGVAMERVLARRFGVRSVSLHAYRGAESPLREALRASLALDRPGSPVARSGRASLLRLSLLVQPGPEGVREAEQKLRDFYAQLAPTLHW